MKTGRTLAIACAVLLAAYVAWPLWSAYELRQALRSADSAALAPRVEWRELRANLKARIAGNLKPRDGASWLRRQTARVLVPFAAGSTVEALVTPERLAWFLKRRMQLAPQPAPSAPPPVPTGGPAAEGTGDEPETTDPLAPRRLRWAFFESPSRFRVEVADTTRPTRRLVALLELRGFAWKLVDIFYLTRE